MALHLRGRHTLLDRFQNPIGVGDLIVHSPAVAPVWQVQDIRPDVRPGAPAGAMVCTLACTLPNLALPSTVPLGGFIKVGNAPGQADQVPPLSGTDAEPGPEGTPPGPSPSATDTPAESVPSGPRLVIP